MANLELSTADADTKAAILGALGGAGKDSAALTGTPTAPTPTAGDHTTKIATTDFVKTAVEAGGGGGGDIGIDDVEGLTEALNGKASTSDLSTLSTAVGGKAPLADPHFTGTPHVPTATAGTNTDQAASTAFVKAAVDAAGGGGGEVVYATQEEAEAGTRDDVVMSPLRTAEAIAAQPAGDGAPLNSPAFTGNPTAPTQTLGNRSTRLATTEFVKEALNDVLGVVEITETYQGAFSGGLVDFGNPLFTEISADFFPATGGTHTGLTKIYRAPVDTLPGSWSGSPIQYYWLYKDSGSGHWVVDYQTVADPTTRTGFATSTITATSPVGAYASGDFNLSNTPTQLRGISGCSGFLPTLPFLFDPVDLGTVPSGVTDIWDSIGVIHPGSIIYHAPLPDSLPGGWGGPPITQVYLSCRNVMATSEWIMVGTGSGPGTSATIATKGLGTVDGTYPFESAIYGPGSCFGASMVLSFDAPATPVDFSKPAASVHSPAFQGTPTAPTPSAGDNSTKLATTAFVKQALEPADVLVLDTTDFEIPWDVSQGLFAKADLTGSGQVVLSNIPAGAEFWLLVKKGPGGLAFNLPDNAYPDKALAELISDGPPDSFDGDCLYHFVAFGNIGAYVTATVGHVSSPPYDANNPSSWTSITSTISSPSITDTSLTFAPTGTRPAAIDTLLSSASLTSADFVYFSCSPTISSGGETDHAPPAGENLFLIVPIWDGGADSSSGFPYLILLSTLDDGGTWFMGYLTTGQDVHQHPVVDTWTCVEGGFPSFVVTATA